MQTEGYQDKQVKKRESVWLPSLPQVLLYVSTSLLLVATTHRNIIFSWLGGDALTQLGGVGFITEGENFYLDNLFAIPILGTITVIFFWAALGCTIYCIVWGLTNTLHEAKKYGEVSGESVMPEGYNKQKFWSSSLANIILMVSSAFAFILLLFLAFGYAIPVSSALLTNVLANTLSVGSLVSILVFLLASIAVGHGLYLSMHTFNYARKIVFF